MSLTQIFQEKVPEVFSFLSEELGFNFESNNANTMTASHGDVNVNFVLDQGILFSVGIKLTGKLGEIAIDDARYRSLGATVIARSLDRDYRPQIIFIRNENDLINQMQERANVLKKYCGEILKGDVSDWKHIIDCVVRGNFIS